MVSQKKKNIPNVILYLLLLVLLAAFFILEHFPLPEVPNETISDSVDTQAPVISCDIKTKTVLPGETVSIKTLGVHTQDKSEIKHLAFTKISSTHFYTGLPEEEMKKMRETYEKGIDFFGEDFQFAYGGEYILTIEACDNFDNRSEIDVTIRVEEPPIIEATSDFYLAEKTEIDFKEYVTAWDFFDEDFSSENLIIDSASVNTARTGTYPITFTGTDNYGLSQTITSSVHICSKEELQKLINTHQININETVIAGAYNAYDMGYFENTDIETVQTAITPAIVQIENSSETISGSGFIVKIDDEMVTLCTCAHVVLNCMTPEVIFEDGTARLGSVVRYDEASDVAFIRIPIDGSSLDTSLSSDYVKNLRTIHIDETYWENHKNTDLITISNEQEANTSGSAIFDKTGRLFGMACAHSSTSKADVPLSEILRQYELTFKKKLQYQ